MSQERQRYRAMTRTSYCPICKVLGFPRHETAYVVYGSERQDFDCRIHRGDVRSNNLGFTPHIFFNECMETSGNSLIDIPIICGTIGCGVSLERVNEGSEGWAMKLLRDPRIITITFNDFFAALNYKDREDYYLNNATWVYPDVEKVVVEQIKHISTEIEKISA